MKRCLLTMSLLWLFFKQRAAAEVDLRRLPPPVGGFSKSDLNGQYAFTMVGNDPTGNVIARVGVFIVDGSGNIQEELRT